MFYENLVRKMQTLGTFVPSVDIIPNSDVEGYDLES